MSEAAAARKRVDTDKLRAQVDIAEVIGRYVALKKDGTEFKARCPFHDERSPSFYVSPVKQFYHCFGCGAHGDVIRFVMEYDGLDFGEAVKKIGGDDIRPAEGAAPPQKPDKPREGKWVALLPVPDDAPDLLQSSGWTVPVWNPKRSKFSRFQPTRADAYRDAKGRLLGYVLRCEFNDGKVTPTITWCIGPDGAMQWCIRPFPTPRPLYGLDDIAARPDAPVLLVEGEKCRAAGAGALPMYVTASWPGGGKGIPYVDWSPLEGRDVVLWPDADEPGRQAMLGWRDYAGRFHPGIAQSLHRVGVRSMRFVDTDGQPKGWDIADAIADG
ncbi:MAG TPA: DNA primase, partial [Arenimonas sp.]|nr:DNA primase [Arenimonas sp.]